MKTTASSGGGQKSHSRFIPEAERGWSTPPSSTPKRAGSFSIPRLPAMQMRWPVTGSPKKKADKALAPEAGGLPAVRTMDMSEGDERSDGDDDSEGLQRFVTAGQGSLQRWRTTSDPSSPGPGVGVSARPKGLRGDDDEDGNARRKSVDIARNDSQELAAPILYDVDPRPGLPSNLHSRSSSVQMRRPKLEPAPSSSKYPARGFAWRSSKRHHDGDEADEGEQAGEQDTGFVKPSHRNPTATQAFYDTHFGASSGWRSVQGLADPVFHPFESVKRSGLLGRWTGTVPEDGEADRGKRRSDIFAGWAALPSLGLFGSSGSKEDLQQSIAPSSRARSEMQQQQQQQQQFKMSNGTGDAYEPELIPTVHRDPNSHSYFRHLDSNVVIMGGYRGSVLRDAETKQMMWVPLKVGVGLRRPTLELGLEIADEDEAESLVVPGDMLSGIGHMVDMGRRLRERCQHGLEKARKKRADDVKQADVYSWGYDWRLSLGRASEQLQAFLLKLWEESAPEEENRRGASVVAHSMGGLVALNALCRTDKPEIFRSLVFASTPFLGTANILGPFRFGDAALFNDTVCSPRATFSFRSSFYLLPTDPDGGRCFEEEDGQPHDVDFLDPATWDELGLSPCVRIGGRSLLTQANDRQPGERVGRHEENLANGSVPNQVGNKRGEQELEQQGHEDRAQNVPSFPGPGLQMMSSPSSADTSSFPSGGPRTMQDVAGSSVMDAALGAAQRGHQIVSGTDTDNQQTLQPANRRESGSKQSSKDVKEEDRDSADNVDAQDDEARASWIYLERVGVLQSHHHTLHC